jgi:hypothetical protein
MKNKWNNYENVPFVPVPVPVPVRVPVPDVF